MKTTIELLKKRRSVILYLTFGIRTTLINLSVYPICYYFLDFQTRVRFALHGLQPFPLLS